MQADSDSDSVWRFLFVKLIQNVVSAEGWKIFTLRFFVAVKG